MKSAPVLDDQTAAEVKASAEPTLTSAGLARRAGAFLLREFLEILPPTIFFIIGFNLIVLTTSEFNHLFGKGELKLWHLLFTSRPSELPLDRRQRILELVRLSKLADAHSVAEFNDPKSAAHTQLVEIVRRLAAEPNARAS